MKFHISYEGNLISVEQLSRSTSIYSIEFPDQSVIFITQASSLQNNKFWTSIPQGNEKLAVELGKLIEEYLEINGI